jgi:hypothetical protein
MRTRLLSDGHCARLRTRWQGRGLMDRWFRVFWTLVRSHPFAVNPIKMSLLVCDQPAQPIVGFYM